MTDHTHFPGVKTLSSSQMSAGETYLSLGIRSRNRHTYSHSIVSYQTLQKKLVLWYIIYGFIMSQVHTHPEVR